MKLVIIFFITILFSLIKSDKITTNEQLYIDVLQKHFKEIESDFRDEKTSKPYKIYVFKKDYLPDSLPKKIGNFQITMIDEKEVDSLSKLEPTKSLSIKQLSPISIENKYITISISEYCYFEDIDSRFYCTYCGVYDYYYSFDCVKQGFRYSKTKITNY
jgi:hypothetical protein